jgi:hypothetical protein
VSTNPAVEVSEDVHVFEEAARTCDLTGKNDRL